MAYVIGLVIGAILGVAGFPVVFWWVASREHEDASREVGRVPITRYVIAPRFASESRTGSLDPSSASADEG